MNENPSKNEATRLGRRRSRSVRPALAILVVIVVAALLVPHSWRDAIESHFERKTEPITELYFTDPNALPKTVRVGQTFQVAFTIANHEGQQVTYSYRVSTDQSGTMAPVKVDTVTIANGATANIAVTVPASTKAQDFQVLVDLLNRTEHISFHATAS